MYPTMWVCVHEFNVEYSSNSCYRIFSYLVCDVSLSLCPAGKKLTLIDCGQGKRLRLSTTYIFLDSTVNKCFITYQMTK